ncbi:MAG: tetratricopeptide repeat protein [Planctomycetaceae bacterium]|nr:tetratricopeptide repeat protein [Planctomycetaceae bacterium]
MVLSRFRHFLDVLRSLWPRSTVRLIRKGARLREQGKLDEAIAVLDQAISLNPQLAEAYAHRCACYSDREEYAKAIEDADRAIALDPKIAWVYRARALAWYCLDELDSALADMDEALRLEPQNAAFQHSRAQVLLGLGRIDEASAQYEAAAARAPDLRGGWLGGAILLKQGKWRDAVEHYSAMLEADPTDARAYYDRGEAWYCLGEYEHALRDIDEALRLGPVNAASQHSRAQVLFELGRIDEASAQYESALARDPDLGGGWLGGALALKQGNYQEAIEHFKGELEADPTNARAHYDRGLAWYHLGEYGEALCDLDEAVCLAPKNRPILQLRAKLLFLLDRIEEASAAYETALAQEPEAEKEWWSSERIWLGGAIALKQGNYCEAIAQFDAVLDVDPTHSRVYNDRGEAWYRQGEYEPALRDFDRAVELDPEHSVYYINRANARMGLARCVQATRDSRLSECESVLRDLDEAIRLEPERADTLHLRATVLFDELGRFDEAFADYEAALKLNPELGGDWLGGAIALKRGHFKEAIEQFDAVLETDPTRPRVYFDRAEAWYRLREYGSALRDVDQAIRLGPDVARYLRFRAQVLLEAGQIDEASAQYEAARVQDPGFKEGWLGGAIALKQGKFREAIEQFDAELEAHPTRPRVYFDRADAWYRLREYDNALRDIDEAIKLKPEIAGYQFFRAHVLLELGRVDEASAHYEAALVQDPGFKEGWLAGAIALKQGKFREAIEQFNTVLEADPTHSLAYHYRGEAWCRLGEYENALRDFDEATRLAPDCVSSLMFLAWLRATCPDAELRNGKLAVAMAHKAAELAGGEPSSRQCAVLAAAYAEAGDFAEAIRWQSKALATATEKRRSRQQDRLERYQAGTPLRMPDVPDSES